MVNFSFHKIQFRIPPWRSLRNGSDNTVYIIKFPGLNCFILRYNLNSLHVFEGRMALHHHMMKCQWFTEGRKALDTAGLRHKMTLGTLMATSQYDTHSFVDFNLLKKFTNLPLSPESVLEWVLLMLNCFEARAYRAVAVYESSRRSTGTF